MGFAVTCSSAHKFYIHTLKYPNVCNVHSHANILTVLNILPCSLKHFHSDCCYTCVNSLTQTIYISNFFYVNDILYTSPQEKIQW